MLVRSAGVQFGTFLADPCASLASKAAINALLSGPITCEAIALCSQFHACTTVRYEGHDGDLPFRCPRDEMSHVGVDILWYRVCAASFIMQLILPQF